MLAIHDIAHLAETYTVTKGFSVNLWEWTAINVDCITRAEIGGMDSCARWLYRWHVCILCEDMW